MANKTFSNFNDLYKYLEFQIPINLEKIGEEIKGVLKRFILTDWYAAHLPTHYERTNSLINSLKVSKAKKIGKSYEVMIFFDSELLPPAPSSEVGYFPSYMNVTNGDTLWEGESLSILVPWFIEEGQSSKIHSYKGIHMVRKTVDWAIEDNYIRTRMIELLEYKGFKCI